MKTKAGFYINAFKNHITLAVCCCLVFTNSFSQPTQSKDDSKATQTGYAPVNGLKMYYETYGEGKPLVLLHGAFMTINTNFSEMIPTLSKNRRVIAVELQ